MAPRPYVILSVATSIDGRIDDAGPDRLLLSDRADFDRVDEVRAGVDAILVGAQTLRADDPRLLVNSAERRAARVAAGRSEHPLKVALSGSGRLRRDLRFWHHGGAKLVYTTDPGRRLLEAELAGLADVVALGGPTVDLAAVLDDLGGRGIGRLMVEGGGAVHTEFLARGLADELHLAIAPLLVGEAAAPRFLHDAAFPPGRMRVGEVRRLGDVVCVQYFPKDVEPPS